MSNNKFKILVIEDEANISSFVETLLNTNGYQVLTASTCAMGRFPFFCRITRILSYWIWAFRTKTDLNLLRRYG